MSEVLSLTPETFEHNVLNNSRPVFVDFWAAWCGPCQLLAPTMNKLAEQLADQATVAKVNIDDHPVLAQRYGISALPTVVLFQNGEVVDEVVGLKSADAYLSLLNQVTA